MYILKLIELCLFLKDMCMIVIYDCIVNKIDGEN